MKKSLIGLAGLFVLFGAAGCNQQKSPDAVANDVAKAADKASAEVAAARKDAVQDSVGAAAKVEDKAVDLDNTNAKGAYDIAVARADGNHQVAIEQCKVASGDAQKACKDQADADYDLAKANAKATLAAQKQ
jgi:hypothetical protein